MKTKSRASSVSQQQSKAHQPSGVSVHLISAPWATVRTPSIQISALKAYLDDTLGKRIITRTYSAFLTIPTLADRESVWPRFYIKMAARGELPYFFLFHRRFGSTPLPNKTLSQALRSYGNTPWPRSEPLSVSDLDLLEKATIAYIEDRLLPHLSKNQLNVIGFTLNFNQIHASLFIEKYLLRNFPQFKYVFLYGGYHAAAPQGVQLLKDLKASGYCVAGEGEQKLLQAIESLMASPQKPLDIPGVFDLRSSCQTQPPIAQISTLQDLPLPDFSEFFAEHAQLAKRDPVLRRLSPPRIMLEGTRGCYANCDFCAKGGTFSGFRKISGDLVFERVKALSKKYKARQVTFTDNVCDTWAKDYANQMIDSGLEVEAFMEHRAHFKQEHWALLARAGVRWIQLGVEAYSPPLLRNIGKGTTVIQNLVAQKCLQELGIQSLSNLITYHPKSTLADVNETRRILMATPHFPKLSFSPFHLNVDSPLFNSLTAKEKARLKLKPRISFRKPLSGLAHSYFYEVPPGLKPSASVRAAWAKLEKDFEKRFSKWEKQKPQMVVTELSSGKLRVRDARTPQVKTTTLSGETARVFNACHSGPRIPTIARLLSLSETEVADELGHLVKSGLVLRVEDHFLALPLRPMAQIVGEWAFDDIGTN